MRHKEVQNLVSLSAAVRLSQDGWQMEIYYVTEIKCGGQDKRDIL
jgi:hypothetical protein